MNILRGQEQVSQKRALPVNDTNLSTTVSTSSSATVQLYYYAAGVRTSDAGQAAGTVVDAVFVHKNILNSIGTNVATANDTSLAYTCTALTTELEWASKPEIQALMEGLDNSTLSTRAAQIGALLNNGEFIVDYRRGLLIGRKATTASTMTSVTYIYTAGGSGAITSVIPGTGATNLGKAEDADHANGDVGVVALARRIDSPASSASASGKYATQNQDANGNGWVSMGTKISGEDQTNDVMKTQTQMAYTNISASALIKSGAGQLAGFVVNSCGAGATLKLWDNTSAATTVLLNTMTFTAAVAHGPMVVTIPGGAGKFGTGLYATIAVAAMDVTFFYN